MALVVPNTFTNGTNADATKVNDNFDTIASYVNTNAILKDGSVSFTGLVTGPTTTPTSDDHLARKKYVDDTVAGTWTQYTPYFTNVTNYAGNDSFYYRVIGKTLDFHGTMSFSTSPTATAAGYVGIRLPSAYTAAGTVQWVQAGRFSLTLKGSLAFITSGDDDIRIYKDMDGTEWNAGDALSFLAISGRVHIN